MATSSARRTRALLIGATIVAIGSAAAYLGATRGGRVPDPHRKRRAAPAIELVDLDGAPLSLAALRGKVVLIDFWATWCGPCRDEVPQLIELQRTYEPRGVQLVGIAMDDDAEPVRDFIRVQPPNYPIVIGDAELGERFGGVLGLPVKFLIDRDGRVAGQHAGAVDPAALARELDALLAE
jgi:thiol-disulfide isomerase/thioredoxin